MLNRRSLPVVVLFGAALFFGLPRAQAQITITGTVSSGKYLLTGALVKNTTHAVLKMSFESTTAGSNLRLCSGTTAQFNAGTCGTDLNDSGGPGFTFLTIIDAADLSGLQLYVLLSAGTSPASFTFSIQ